MAQEVERKFLLAGFPDFLEEEPFDHIRQGYIATEKGGNEVRVRDMNDSYWLTVKSSGELNRTEVEIPLDIKDFNQLWELTESQMIEKNRYELLCGDGIIEIDVFKGKLDGLVMAEIEFDSVEQAKAFFPPTWMVKEVTYDSYYKNRNLAKLDSYNPTGL